MTLSRRVPSVLGVVLLLLGLAGLSLTAATGTAHAADRTLPLRAAFMYPWYPETWEAGQHFTPTAGLYDSGTQATVDRQIDQAQYGGLDAFITSFWGAGTPTGQRLPLIVQEAAAKGFAIASYYEPEGTADPTVSQIQTDLAAIPSTSPGYLHVGGKPVLFVYNANDTSCSIVDKYRQAAPGWYIDLKVFSGYQNCASQPDSWHQYGPASNYDQQGTFSASVSPGFFKYSETTPRLARDVTRFTNDITTAKNSGAQWQLITSYNEWGEGTSVEPANEWASPSGFGTYLDAMHNVFGSSAPPPAPPVTVTSNPTADSYVGSDVPNTNFGTATLLKTDNSPVDHAYLKFNVGGLVGQPVAKATLRLYIGSAGTTPVDVRRVVNTAWTETGLTYANAPAGSGTPVSHATTGAGYVDFDVTPWVTGEGAVAFDTATTATVNRSVYSRESANKPQLVVTTTGVNTPPPPANTPPTAAFTSSVNGLAASVDGSTSTDAEGPISSYAWNFGDSATGTGVTASHTYAAAGTYNVQLTVTDSGGLTNTVTHAVTVAATPPANTPPTAAFTSSVSGSTASVDGTTSTDAEGPIASYAWNWGSGAPDGSGATATHTYTVAGTYNVTLTVTDSGGLTSTVTHPVTVATTPPANTPPTAAFTSSVTGNTVAVDGTTSSDAEGPISSYAWNWGSGSPDGSGATATHTYATAGTYNVTLTVTDSGGLTGTVTHAVTVAAPPPPPGNAVTKVLVIMEENHSLAEMQSGMPYDFSLAQQYGYATGYKGITHPSLPNYLAIAGGTTAGVTDDNAPSSHPISASSVFGQAIANGKTAKAYDESMTSNCQLTSSGAYAVKHNPWAYYTPSTERPQCQQFDVPETALAGDISSGNLPNVGMVTPNLNNDAHDGSLATADNWLKTRMQEIFAGPDWQSGHLAVIITADEDDSSQSNLVLTTVVHPSQSGHVVSTPLNHYSLTRLMEDVAHTSHLANAATAADMASAFALPIG